VHHEEQEDQKDPENQMKVKVPENNSYGNGGQKESEKMPYFLDGKMTG